MEIVHQVDITKNAGASVSRYGPPSIARTVTYFKCKRTFKVARCTITERLPQPLAKYETCILRNPCRPPHPLPYRVWKN